MGLENIKAVFIDIDNTLLDFGKGARVAMEQCFEKFGLRFEPRMYAVFTEINDELWHRIERGELTKDGLHAIRWKLIFKELGIDADGVVFEEEFRAALRLSAIPVDGAMELLEYLNGKGYTVCAASNASLVQQETRLTRLGMIKYMHSLFVSEKIGYPKPSREFFRACVEELGEFSADEIVIIGDSLTADIYGGIDFGIHTIWFNYENREVPSGLAADAVVYRLSDIRCIL